jgi:pSer/pThr/pTyr-binding forkhead associated (FHA) protein
VAWRLQGSQCYHHPPLHPLERVQSDGAGHRIVDIGSTNGLLYQGQRIPANVPLTLADGDVIRIGDPIGGSFVTLAYANPAVARVRQVTRINLPTRSASLVIGREPGQAVLDSPQVSRRHAIIEARPDGSHVLRDLNSANGTYVNGQRIATAQEGAGL